MKSVEIHTDGACEGNPGPGGWAAILRYGKHARELCGAEAATTNNRMELSAAIKALSALKEPCTIDLFTDSEYLRTGVTEWLAHWKARNWRRRGSGDVKNGDLWKALDAATTKHTISWHWLKGHAGHPDNEKCDLLARAAIVALRQRYTPEQLADGLATFRASRKDRETGELLT